MITKMMARYTSQLCKCCGRRLLWVRKGNFGWLHCTNCDQPR